MLSIMATSKDVSFPSPLPPKVAAPTRSDMIVEWLKSAIFARVLEPGEVLVERRIAERLGVSKTPVREALIVLERMGLVVMQNRSFEVRTLTLTDIRHIYEERILLEPWAIVDAARMDGKFAAAGQALAEARVHAAAGDAAELALANRRFHRGMYSSSENSFVVRALDSLQDLTALAVTGVLWGRWPRSDEEALQHEAIYEAAQSGDAEAAAELMREHIYASIDRLTRSEKELGG